MLELIMNRIQADVDAAEALYTALDNVGWEGLSPDQKSFWDSSPKGAYNHNDRNRVELAVKYLQELFNENGYWPWLTTKTDWAESYIPTPADLDRYIGNIAALRSILPVLPGTPEAPETMDGIDWQTANDIERILFNIERIIELMTTWQFYSGELYLGEVLN